MRFIKQQALSTAANLRAGPTGIMAPASSVETRIAMVLLGVIVGAMSMAAWDTASWGARTQARPSVTSITLSAGQFKVAQDEDKDHNPQLRRTDPARTQPCATPSPTSPAVLVPPEGWGYPEAIPKHIHQTWIDTSVPCPSTWVAVNPGFG
jgi:mannosyltransferase OCH1-like enzyme